MEILKDAFLNVSGLALTGERLFVMSVFFLLGYLYGKLTIHLNIIKFLLALFIGFFVLTVFILSHPVLQVSFLAGVILNHRYRLQPLWWYIEDTFLVFQNRGRTRRNEAFRRREEELERREREFRKQQQEAERNRTEQSSKESAKKRKSSRWTKEDRYKTRWSRGYTGKPDRDASESPPKSDRTRRDNTKSSQQQRKENTKQRERVQHKPPPEKPQPKELNPAVLSDAYEILGVSQGASKDECKKARMTLLSMYHPDKVAHLNETRRNMAEEEAKRINAAWERVQYS